MEMTETLTMKLSADYSAIGGVVLGRTGPEPPTTAKVMTRPTVSILKACELTGVSRRSIYNWLQLGKVEYVRTAGGAVRIFADTLFSTEPKRGRG